MQKEPIDQIRDDIRANPNPEPQSLRQHLEDRDERARRDIWALYWREALARRNARLTSAVVHLMIQELPDESPMIQGQIAKWLQDFQKSDFTAARELLLKLSWNADYAPQIIRAIGIAGLREATPRLESEVQGDPAVNGDSYGTNSWAALLALARLGSDDALARVIAKVRQERDIITRATILFFDLAYTLRRPAFEALAEFVFSDKRLPQLKATVPGRLEATYAAAAFARGVRDFPFQDPDLTEAQVMQAREWIRSHRWELKESNA